MLKTRLKKALHLGAVLRLVWHSGSKWMIARIILLVLQGILPLVALYLTKLIIDKVTASISQSAPESGFKHVVVLLILAAVMTLMVTISNSLSELVNTAQGEKITDYIHSILYAKSIEVDLEYYENPQYYDQLQRAQQEAPYRPTQILNRLAQVAQNLISLVAIIGLLVSLYWGLAIIMFIAAIPALIARLNYAQNMYLWRRESTPLARQADYLTWLLTGNLYAKEIRLFNLGNLFTNRFRKIQKQVYQERLTIEKKHFWKTTIAQIFSGILMFSAYGIIVYQTLKGVLQLGDLVLYYQAFQRGQNTVESLLRGLSGLYEDNLFLTNLYDFLELKPKIISPLHPVIIPQPMREGIVFHNVSFEYPNSNRQALYNINLKIRPGEVIALVGENGSGKTTLTKLLCRLYDPSDGQITLDGINLSEFDLKDLRNAISVIFQDYVKYNFSAQENIGLGNIEDLLDEQKIKKAAIKAGADQVIQSLPKGYDTILGNLFAEGEEISIGQWQKIAIARAFLRNSQIIVLDEPTSAIDAKAEAELFARFRQLLDNQAAVLISHRLSTVKMADCIYVLDEGKIVESGSHIQLISLNGLYAHLFEIQAQHYR